MSGTQGACDYLGQVFTLIGVVVGGGITFGINVYNSKRSLATTERKELIKRIGDIVHLVIESNEYLKSRYDFASSLLNHTEPPKVVESVPAEKIQALVRIDAPFHEESYFVFKNQCDVFYQNYGRLVWKIENHQMIGDLFFDLGNELRSALSFGSDFIDILLKTIENERNKLK